MNIHRHRQAQATLQVAAHRLQHLAQVEVAGRLGQPADGTDDRHAGLAQAVHLPAEDDQLIQLDTSPAQAFEQLLKDIGALVGLLGIDLQRGDLLRQQLVGRLVQAGRLDQPADPCALGIASAVAKLRHYRLSTSVRVAHTLSTSSMLVTPASA